MTVIAARTDTAADRVRGILDCHLSYLPSADRDELTDELMQVVESTAIDVAQHVWDQAIPAWVRDRQLPTQLALNVSVRVRPNP